MKSSEPVPDDLEHLVGSTAAGKYRIERLIGRGGMGAVFLATNVAIGKRVALKFLHRDAAADRDRALRFQREAQAAGMIESEHIVHVFDAGTNESGLPFLVMELLQGEDLRERLKRESTLSIADAVNVTTQVLRALVRAHAAGIVHRDLKPDNVFLCRRDDGSLLVKLVDFGISKLSRGNQLERLTRRGTVLGSAYYMSPEQAQASDEVDQRSDIYGVGALLFEMLAGRPPHLGRTLEAILVAICTQPAPAVTDYRPDTPPALAETVARALAREPAARFANASDFLDALGPEGGFTARRRGRGIPRTLVAGIIATLLGFSLTALIVALRRPAAQEPPAPRPETTASPAPSVLAPNPAPTLAATAPPAPVPAPASAVPPATSASARQPPPKATPKASPRAADGSRKPATKKGSGVANSLELSTREP